ncbi:MAG: hypothetical protein II825_08980 [Paludibacteraceae bacterium]|nr:hypothetical protein [Paludibacteraceae bacterium]
MIPHIIHYCWFGQAPLPTLAEKCIASWKKHMPSWELKAWTEASLSLSQALSPLKGEEGCWLDYMPLYVKQAYEARKYAFVSDYVRLWALEQHGGLYLDVDFEVFRPFDELMDKYPAFAGYEGSKRHPVMQGVIASEPHGAWVTDMLQSYQCREFVRDDGSLDMTPNTSYFTDRLEAQGFVADGVEKDFYIEENKENTADAEENIENSVTKNTHSTSVSSNSPHGLECNHSQVLTSELAAPVIANTSNMPTEEPHVECLQKNVDCINQEKNEKNGHADGGIFMLHVFPVHYFCPVLTTGEDVRTAETYCEHKGESSWAQQTWKGRLMKYLSPKWRTMLIKIKRKIFG